jgi:SAM-dependent methyltransferase
VDTQVDDYRKIESSTYSTGEFVVFEKSYKTVLSNLSAEAFGQTISEGAFDTVIMMNVLVYSQDALAFLTTIHKALRPGGMLLFHDRYFPDPVTSSKCKFVGFAMNIIEVNQPVLEHFLSFFSKEPYFSTRQTAGQIHRSKAWCHWLDDEVGYWVAVRKLATP